MNLHQNKFGIRINRTFAKQTKLKFIQMKSRKLYSAISTLLLVIISFATFAKDFELPHKKLKINTSSKMEDKGTVSSGFTLMIGFGNPSFTFRDVDTDPYYTKGNYINQKLQYSFEIGYQFMIYKQEDKFGIGINASWLTLGYSSFTRKFYNDYTSVQYNNTQIVGTGEADYSCIDVNLRLLKVGPQGTFAFGKIALDVNANIIPVTI